jgi:mevalonate pyrophosphate decarboxylase
MSSIAEVFPHDDPVARFVVAMSMARNDVRHALTRAGEANDQDDPEFGYWVRMATGHFFEAAYALSHWRQIDEIKRSSTNYLRMHATHFVTARPPSRRWDPAS